MAENRLALIVAVSEYQDAGLRQLVAPAQDAEALARVLGDPAIGDFAVKTLLNPPSYQINREIEAFFANRAKDDLLLLYFSGHGLKDEEGRLYFATTDTDRKFLRTTAVAATLINDVMHYCRSRRQVLILDCCYSGAFARGMTHRADETVGAGEYFREGRGQFVLTASDALQYAFEGDDVSGEGVRSVFTHTLVRGLETGEADLDGDGAVSCDELYDYLHKRVTDRRPQQKPRKWAFAVEGDIIIARNPYPVVKLAALPAELRQSIEDPRPWVREGAARQLADLLQHGNKGLVVAAQSALRQMAEDDSLKVRVLVADILNAHTEEEPLQTESNEPQTVAAGMTETVRKAKKVRHQAKEGNFTAESSGPSPKTASETKPNLSWRLGLMSRLRIIINMHQGVSVLIIIVLGSALTFLLALVFDANHIYFSSRYYSSDYVKRYDVESGVLVGAAVSTLFLIWYQIRKYRYMSVIAKLIGFIGISAGLIICVATIVEMT